MKIKTFATTKCRNIVANGSILMMTVILQRRAG